MTTDAFTTAARTEAERQAPLDGHVAPALEQERAGLIHMAVWARDHLAAQEPTEELLDYVAAAISECDGIYFQDCIRRNPGIARMYRRQARAALTAARRYEEKR